MRDDRLVPSNAGGGLARNHALERARMQAARFGELLTCDFSEVRIQFDSRVAQACSSPDALALACHNTIFLSPAFDRLEEWAQGAVIAHECAHLAQQGLGFQGSSRPSASIDLESEANLAAGHLLAGRPFTCLQRSVPSMPSAWGCVGHFWSVWLAYLNAQEEDKRAFKTALFCWMPDQVNELDAAHLFKKFAISEIGRAYAMSGNAGMSGKMSIVPPETFERLYDEREKDQAYLRSIHKGLHCLNGNDAARETSFRTRVIQDKSLPFIFRGIAHHSFGDSFAHRQIDSPGKMYNAGLGHAGDLTHPDEVSHPKAGNTYKLYLSELQAQACLWTGKLPIVPVEALLCAIDPMLHPSCRSQMTPISATPETEQLAQAKCGEDESACAEHLKSIARIAIKRPMNKLWYDPIRDPKPWKDYYQEHIWQIETEHPPLGNRKKSITDLLDKIVAKAKAWEVASRR